MPEKSHDTAGKLHSNSGRSHRCPSDPPHQTPDRSARSISCLWTAGVDGNNAKLAYFLSVSLSPSLPPVLLGDKNKFSEIFFCLGSLLLFDRFLHMLYRFFSFFQLFNFKNKIIIFIFWVSSRSHSTVLSLACYANVANVGLFSKNVSFSLGEFRLCFVPMKGTVGRGRYWGSFQTKSELLNPFEKGPSTRALTKVYIQP